MAWCSIHHSTNHAPIPSATLLDQTPNWDVPLAFGLCGLLATTRKVCSFITVPPCLSPLSFRNQFICTVHVYHLPGRTFNQRLFALSFLPNGQFLLQRISFIVFLLYNFLSLFCQTVYLRRGDLVLISLLEIKVKKYCFVISWRATNFIHNLWCWLTYRNSDTRILTSGFAHEPSPFLHL